MKSDSINELATALAKAQGEMTHAAKDAEVKVSLKSGGAYTSKFATLASVFDAVRKPFAANGLAISQLATASSECATVTTILMHSSGQWIEVETKMPIEKPGPHGVGSAISFARRYALGAICGIATDDDDDGNGAQGSTKEEAFTRKPNFPKPGSREDTTWGQVVEPRITKGPATGKLMRDATDDELRAFASHVQGVLDNPAMVAHRDGAIKVLNQIEAEMVGRRE